MYFNGRLVSVPKVTASVTYSPLKVFDLTPNYTGINNSRNRFEKTTMG